MYYSLQRQGVRELRYNAHPDWPQILTSMMGAIADVKARALPYLLKTNFRVVMTESSTEVTLERTDEQPPEGLANLGKLVELVRVSIQQPIDDWRTFTFKPLIPQLEGDCRLEQRSGTYKISRMVAMTGKSKSNWTRIGSSGRSE
jgi:hypothetical protein